MNEQTISNKSETDWQRIDAIPDEDIDLSECPEVTKDMFASAVVRRRLEPLETQAPFIQIDSDVFEWFKKTEEAYQSKINSLLRTYMESQEKSGGVV